MFLMSRVILTHVAIQERYFTRRGRRPDNQLAVCLVEIIVFVLKLRFFTGDAMKFDGADAEIYAPILIFSVQVVYYILFATIKTS
jgi:hypothetical protein